MYLWGLKWDSGPILHSAQPAQPVSLHIYATWNFRAIQSLLILTESCARVRRCRHTLWAFLESQLPQVKLGYVAGALDLE